MAVKLRVHVYFDPFPTLGRFLHPYLERFSMSSLFSGLLVSCDSRYHNIFWIHGKTGSFVSSSSLCVRERVSKSLWSEIESFVIRGPIQFLLVYKYQEEIYTGGSAYLNAYYRDQTNARKKNSKTPRH